MKVIAKKIWTEPAVFIGLLVTIGLLVWELIVDKNWTVQTIVSILAPLASSLGIRQLVTPTSAVASTVEELKK